MFGDEDVDISRVVKRGRGPGGGGSRTAHQEKTLRESSARGQKGLKVEQTRVRKRESLALRKCDVK